jgi:hypothetical protein
MGDTRWCFLTNFYGKAIPGSNNGSILFLQNQLKTLRSILAYNFLNVTEEPRERQVHCGLDIFGPA